MTFDFKVPLFDPPGASVDIVFVHGVRGDPQTTWTRSDVVWPKDLIPSALPTARILSWGYDAQIVEFWQSTATDHSITIHAKCLISDLAGVRNEMYTRPIIFIAHSLGGILCAKALDLAPSLDAHMGEIAKCTRGIVFLGTPLRGSDKAKWAEQGRVFLGYFQDTSSDILQQLKERSAFLVDLVDKLSHLLHARMKSKADVKIVCFWEEDRSKFLGKKFGKAACIDGYPAFPLPGDHSSMCKFDSEEAYGYRKITDTVKAWIEEITRPRCEDSQKESIYQAGHTFGANNGGFQLGNVYSAGSSPAFSEMNFYSGWEKAASRDQTH